MDYSDQSIIEKLNPAQRDAVQDTDKNMLVLAGAGSGKTRVITSKVFYIVAQKRAAINEILAITFTNKAAEEMRNRLKKMLHLGEKQRINVRTFHSFGAFFLRLFVERLHPLTKSFSILDVGQQKSLVKQIFKKHREEKMRVGDFLNVVSTLKRHLIYPKYLDENTNEEVVVKSILGLDYQKVYGYYREYDAQLRESNCLDFDDLLGYTVLLLQKNADLRKYLSRWRYCLVDEYQDSDELQEKIIQFFISAKVFVTLVGDDNQSIYRFRGACVENIFNFSKKVSQVKLVKLEENYRSTQAILDFANAAIKQNPTICEKKLFTQKKDGEKPLFFHFSSDIDEAKWVAQHIAEVGEKDWKETIILFRTNSQTRLVEECLSERGIFYHVVRGLRFYERKEIKMVIHHLNFVVNNKDFIALFACINTPPRGIGGKSLEKIKDFLDKNASETQNVLSLLESKDLAEIVTNKKAANALKNFVAVVKDLSEMIAQNHPLESVVSKVIKDFGIGDYFDSLRNEEERAERRASLDQLIQSAMRWDVETETTNHPVVDFLEYVSLAAAEDGGDKLKSVSLSTVHNAKGLEYKNVYIIGLENEVFPHYFASSPEDIFEERRLFYVAITRAKQNLFLSAAHKKNQFGQINFLAVSPFIEEIPKNLFSSASIFFHSGAFLV